ncbi:F-box protein At5g07610-like [Cornus florida]|uniref:F-box protein At5g07610-like n=1 Tax=Cornus florida TaxID=4283 RepID=UPI00289CC024|nr:F-box protein At5g07610-like [Cornus florida]
MFSVKRSRTVDFHTPSHAASAHTVAANNDLLIQILLHLPIRSLFRFKSMSKHWLSLITDPHFSRLQNHNTRSPSGLFLRRSSFVINPEYDFVPLDDGSSTRAPFRSLTFVNDPYGLIILQSCNGLLCCCSYRLINGKRKYYIYNPTTNNPIHLAEISGSIVGLNRFTVFI